jgi:hypothetical protein
VPCGWVTDGFLSPHQLRRAAADLLELNALAVAVDPERTWSFFFQKYSINTNTYSCMIIHHYEYIYIYTLHPYDYL